MDLGDLDFLCNFFVATFFADIYHQSRKICIFFAVHGRNWTDREFCTNGVAPLRTIINEVTLVILVHSST